MAQIRCLLQTTVIGLTAVASADMNQTIQHEIPLTCEHCHDDATGSAQDNPVPINARSKLSIDFTAFERGEHRDLPCRDCHADARPLPHARLLDTVDCQSRCHSKEAVEYRRSVHALVHATDPGISPGCTDCHRVHQPAAARQVNQTNRRVKHIDSLCLKCHKKKLHATPTSDDGLHQDSVNAFDIPSCVDCHHHHEVLATDDPLSPVRADRVATTCATCHTEINQAYQNSVHGQALRHRVPNAPACTSCHTLHQSKSPISDALSSVVRDCGNCHNKSGLADGRTLYDYYLATGHGRWNPADRSPAVACGDCHGTHNIRAVADKQSELYESNRFWICLNCHQYKHVTGSEFNHYVSLTGMAGDLEQAKGMNRILLLVMTLICMSALVHWYLWKRRQYLEASDPSDTLVHIYTLDEYRSQDKRQYSWLWLILLIAGLAVTGLILLNNDHFWGSLFAGIVGGPRVIRFTHILLGWVLIIGLLIKLITTCRSHRSDSTRSHLPVFGSVWPRTDDLKMIWLCAKWLLRGGNKPQFIGQPYWQKLGVYVITCFLLFVGGAGLAIWVGDSIPRAEARRTIHVFKLCHNANAIVISGMILFVYCFNIRENKLPPVHRKR